jgi:hypothetical protein
LTYVQKGVPTQTDETLNLLLPILAGPIVQKVVDGVVLGYVFVSLVFVLRGMVFDDVAFFLGLIRL